MYERFTDRARKVMQLANQEAQRFNHEYIGTEHVLLGLIKEGSGVAANVLKNLDVDLRRIRLEVEKLVQSGPDYVTMGKLPQTPRTKKVVEYAMCEARMLNHNYVGTEHILLGVLREVEGVAAQVLMNLGLQIQEVRGELLNLLGLSDKPLEAADRFKIPTQDRDLNRELSVAFKHDTRPCSVGLVKSIRNIIENSDALVIKQIRDLLGSNSDAIAIKKIIELLDSK